MIQFLKNLLCGNEWKDDAEYWREAYFTEWFNHRHARSILREIAEQEKSTSNATVKRMARMARGALL